MKSGGIDQAAGQPEKVGPYRLEQRLRAGGMGAVWLGQDERLKRPVALKQILPAATPDPKLRERFRREAEAVARLNHPAIVHIYDIVETETADWIVMELVEGSSLQDLLREGPLPPIRAIRLAREIAEGLSEVHAHGFIHRDLKSSNVMVTPFGHAKILDFGVAKQIGPDDQDSTLSGTGMIIGTSHAMSPEQAMGLPLDGRSDLFSLGSLLYEMVTGVAPFRAETTTATLARVCSLRQRPASSIRPDVPHDLSDLIDRLLEKDPVDRPGSAAEVAGLLGELTVPRDSQLLSALGSRNLAKEEETLCEGRLFIPSSEPASAPRSATTVPSTSARLRQAAWSGLVLLLVIVAGVLLAPHVAPPDPYILYQEGQAYLNRYDKEGNLDKAIESFQRILTEDSQHAAAHAALARAYWMKHQGESKDSIWLEQGLAMAQRSVALDKHLAIAWVSLGLVDYSSGRLVNAERDFRQALRLEPTNADAHYGLGRVHEAQGKIQAAESAHRRAIALRKDRIYYDELGSLYFRTARFDKAIDLFRRSVEIAPDSFYGYRNLGAAYHARGDFASAAAQFQKALQIQPDASLYSNLGTLYFSNGFYQESIEAFERALDMPGGTNSHELWGNLGDACRWTPGQEERASEAYLRGIQLLREQLNATPEGATLRSRLALYLAKRGDREEALRELEKLERITSKDALTDYRMAVAYEVAAARGKALAALDKALRKGFPEEQIRKDPELLALREDRRYHKLAVSLSSF